MYAKNPVLQTNPDSVSRIKMFSQILGGIVIAIGCLVIVGWEFNITILKSVLPGLANMKSMTAVLFILSGTSLCLQVFERRRIAQVCAAIVALVGLLTLGEYLFHWNFGIDQLFFRDPGAGIPYPGRMVPAAALSFLLIGIALIVLDNSNVTHQDVPILVTFAISMLALTGYLYGASALYRIGEYSSMALHTAVCFLLLSLGILFARPERGMMQTIMADTAGGHVLRRFLPATIVLPTILGWIRLMGQRAGLYDASFGLAIMVISLITSLYILIWINARQLTEIDRKRKQADDTSRSSDLRFHRTLQTLAEGCQIIGYDWRYLYVNDSAVQHSGLPWEKMIGRTVMECFPDIQESSIFPALRRGLQERIPAILVDSMLLPNGSRRWFEWRIEPSPDGIFVLSNDVTKRKQAEQALLEREMQLFKLFEILPVGISILDAKRQVTYSNPALNKILHVSEQALHRGVYADRTYLKPDGTPMGLEDLASSRAFREQSEIDDLETGIVIEDGTTVWTSVSAVPVNLGDWKLVIVTMDITERKLAENALQEEKRKYSTLFDKSAFPVALLRLPEIVIVDTNESLEKLVGYSKQEMLGRNAVDLGLAQPPKRMDLVRKFETDGTLTENETSIRTRSGEERIVLLNTNPLQLSGGHYAISTMQDITERKLAEAALRLSAENFSKAFLSSPAALLITRLSDGKYLELNQAYCDIVGYDRSELMGHYTTDFNIFIHPEDRKAIVARLLAERSVRDFETSIRHRSGDIRYVQASQELITLNGEQCILSSLIDMTERRKAEQAIVQLNTELEEKVLQRTAELAMANERLQQLSILDELTGLYNRRGFLLLAEEQILLARRTKSKLITFYADLDGLKQINDERGHHSGDEAIKAAAQTLNETFRVSDIKARLGGDEFIVLAIEASESDAPTLLTRLQERLDDHNLSISVGIVTVNPQNEINLAELVNYADHAMYKVKLQKRGPRPGYQLY